LRRKRVIFSAYLPLSNKRTSPKKSLSVILRSMNESFQYMNYIRPDWAPPGWLFGPVWAVLYTVIAVSFAAVFWAAWKKEIPRKVAIPFALNLVFNFTFTWIQFGLQNNPLAFIDIILVLATIIWSMKVVWSHKRWVAYAQIPYLIWVLFATVLQASVTYLNL